LYDGNRYLPTARQEVAMRASAHARFDHNDYFHMHPWHSLFTLISSALLAGLVVLALVESVK
jgi:hypothetical protein